MSDFSGDNYQMIILEGGENHGVTVPVHKDVNMVQFYVKGGGIITYRRISSKIFRYEAADGISTT